MDMGLFQGCGLVAANPAPNRKRLAQRSQWPHRPHLTGRRKIPMFLWGAFSAPGLNAGEGGGSGVLFSFSLNSYFVQRIPGRATRARHVGLDK